MESKKYVLSPYEHVFYRRLFIHLVMRCCFYARIAFFLKGTERFGPKFGAY